MSNKVITASAGTGKTYRLSVEYIKCLLEMFGKGGEENCFRHILVITFTRKATAEIRSRVFKQLKDLLERKHESDVYGTLSEQRKHELSNDEFVWLEKVYHNMCVNRHKIQIRTIDGFINSIFVNVVARLININNINVLNDDHNDDVYISVLDELWKDDKLRKSFSDIYLTQNENIKDARTTDKCIDIIRNLIKQRGIFVLRIGNILQADDSKAATCLKNAQDNYASFIGETQKILLDRVNNKKGKLPSIADLNKDYWADFKDEIESATDITVESFCEMLESKICYDDKWLKKNAKNIVVNGPSKLFDGNVVGKNNDDFKAQKDYFDSQIRADIMSYLFYTDILKDNKLYQDMLEKIYRIYDNIIHSAMEFTHEDVLLNVYETMMNPSFGLCRGGVITDEFSKQLSAEFQYMMIDEFQDTSVLQWATLMPILLKCGSVIVGDEKQAIYDWRGGEKELLGNVPKLLKTEPEMLKTSFRSYHNVIHYVNDIFADNLFSNNVADGKDADYFKDETFSANSIMQTINDKLGDQKWLCPMVKCQKKNKPEKGLFEIYFDTYNGKTKDNQIERDNSACLEYFVNEVVIPKITNPDIPDYDKRYGQTAILARKNAALEEIASLLNEKRIPTYIESSSSLFLQNAVIGVMALLRYLTFEDYHSFFEFVRSDIICADSNQTQQLLRHFRNNKQKIDFENEELIRDYPFLRIIANLRSEYNTCTSIFALISRIYKDFGVQCKFADMADAKALHQLLDIALQFDSELVDYNKSLAGFLLYIDDIYKETKPDGVETTNAVKLMSIHKSKGLEFDNVFVWNYIGRGNNQSDPIVSLFKYNQDFSNVENYTIMKSKYHTALKACRDCEFDDEYLASLRDSIIENDKKEFVSEMNALYVALTRPAMNLIVYNVIEASKGYNTALEELNKIIDKNKTSDIYTDKNVVLSLYDKYITNGDAHNVQHNSIDETHEISVFSDGVWELVPPKEEEEEENEVHSPFSFEKMGEYIRYDLWQPDIESARAAQLSDDDEFALNIENAKTSFGERKRLFGIAVHYYMSKIIYADKEEKRLAHRALYMKYGNILDNEAIDKAACVADKFISKFAYLFDRNKWNRVLNEQWLTAPDGSLRRLDRIMFNTDTHEILIADYKTGKEDKEQLKEYTELVNAKVGNGWTIDAKNFFL